MPRTVELDTLPDCDVCKLWKVGPRQATADSVVRLPGRRDSWAYTCEGHKEFRVGVVTPLVKARG